MNGLFPALDDPTRRRILDLLGQRDLSAGEIAAEFSLGKPTVSHHLGLLRRAGLVSSRKAGQSVVYRLEATVLDECLSWFISLVERGKHPRHPTHENLLRLLRHEWLQTVLLAVPFVLAAWSLGYSAWFYQTHGAAAK